jgi:hypothetical protein
VSVLVVYDTGADTTGAWARLRDDPAILKYIRSRTPRWEWTLLSQADPGADAASWIATARAAGLPCLILYTIEPGGKPRILLKGKLSPGIDAKGVLAKLAPFGGN